MRKIRNYSDTPTEDILVIRDNGIPTFRGNKNTSPLLFRAKREIFCARKQGVPNRYQNPGI